MEASKRSCDQCDRVQQESGRLRCWTSFILHRGNCDKAERKQEQDKKREAEQAKEKPATVPPNFEQYIQQKKKEKELLETIPAEMQPYYKEKTKEYFKKVGE